jgi:RNA polymerase sigma-70 factor (ECF subfamily)
MNEHHEPSNERVTVEREIHALCDEGDIGGAVERTLQLYGREILRLMHSVLHQPDLARDAFSVFSENLMKGLPAFRWESSLRTWAYRVARNACYQVMHAPSTREQPMSLSALPEAVQYSRTETHPWQRTSVKDRFRELRERLKPEERMLLMLRVDQRLSWTEIARVMAEQDEEKVGSTELARRAAALRQQFQRLKTHLRELAMQEGLLASDAGTGQHH